VAQQVRNLERRLGVTLFERLARGLALSPAGHRYLGPVRAAFGLIAEATNDIALRPDLLTISVPPSFAARFLVPRLKSFTDAHPDIDVRIAATNRLADFTHDGIDIAVRLGRGGWPDVVTTRLLDFAVLPVAAPGLKGVGRIRRPGDLQGQVLLHDAHASWEAWFEQAGIAAPAAARGLHFNQTALAIDAAVAGQGIALAVPEMVAADLAAGRLVAPLGQAVPTGLAFWIVHPPKITPKVAAMRDWLLVEK
jgi:LysR family glycine cleavage system transcriptional activator